MRERLWRLLADGVSCGRGHERTGRRLRGGMGVADREALSLFLG